MRALVVGITLLALGLALGYAAGRAAVAPLSLSEWREVGQLGGPRSYLDAVALVTGEIAVFNGIDPERPGLAYHATELLDPRTGSIAVFDERHRARINASVTTLPSGVVAVAGGTERQGDDWAQVAVVELFDPWAKAWRRTAAMRESRAEHGATVLRDGRLMVAGGHRGKQMLGSTEIYDPRTETWARAAPLPHPRQHFSMATLPDGRVLVAGGFEFPGAPARSSFYYDPARDSWERGPHLTWEHALHATVVLPNGDVLLVAGQETAAGFAERYDARLGRFVYAGSLAQPRVAPQAALLQDGRVVVVGGLPRPILQRPDPFDPTEAVEIWDPRTNAWTRGPELREGSALGALVATPEGVWLIGGASVDERPLARVVLLR